MLHRVRFAGSVESVPHNRIPMSPSRLGLNERILGTGPWLGPSRLLSPACWRQVGQDRADAYTSLAGRNTDVVLSAGMIGAVSLASGKLNLNSDID